MDINFELTNVPASKQAYEIKEIRMGARRTNKVN